MRKHTPGTITMHTRREFLGAAGLSFVSLSGFAPQLFAQAAQESEAAAKNDRVLVVVELSGGNDGLNTVIPFENDLYYKNRRALGIPKANVHKIADSLGLHPSLEALAELYKEGRLSVVQGVGYPQPDRSHFRSMEIWHTASTNKQAPTTGWLGRVVDDVPKQSDDSLPGLAFTGSLPLACRSDNVVMPVVGELEAFANAELPEQKEIALRRKLSTTGTGNGPGKGPGKGPVQFLRNQSAAVYRTVDKLKGAAEKYKSMVEYPGSPLGGQLKHAAQILAGDLGVRVMYASQDGYDTHSNQPEQHAALLADLAASLAAFDKDLRGLDMADKVAVVVFSEFGRRVDENASNGTDHGAASCLFVAGAKIKGGLYGDYPRIDKLDEGDLIFNTDFRSVYATLLDKWLGCESKQILGAEFPALNFV
jgi:uncharacterized protein (DUF1501 family)